MISMLTNPPASPPQERGGLVERITTLIRRRAPALLALCDQGILSVTNFGTAVVIGRVCGKHELGIYSLAWTLINIATDISGMLTTIPYTVISPSMVPNRRRRYLGSILLHQLVLGVGFAAAIAVSALAGLAFRRLSGAFLQTLIVTAVAILFICMREFARRVCFAGLKVGWVLCIDVAASFIQVGGIVLMVRGSVLSAPAVCILLGVSSASTAAAWLYVRRHDFRIDLDVQSRDLRRNWQQAKWVLSSGVLSALARYVYPWLLAFFHGPASTGTWAACMGIVAAGNPIILGLGNYVLPKLSTVRATLGLDAMRRQAYRASVLFGAALSPIVLVVAFTGDRVVTTLYGPAYAGTALIILLLALNMVTNAATSPYSQGLFSLESARADTTVNLFWVALLFAVGVPAVKYAGALGAAFSLTGAGAVAAVVRVEVFSREIRNRSLCPIAARPAMAQS
jgi:O-antigen/teichoic acid export membrane protein